MRSSSCTTRRGGAPAGLTRVIDAVVARGHPVLPVTDTLRRWTRRSSAPCRSDLWRPCRPLGFRWDVLIRAHEGRCVLECGRGRRPRVSATAASSGDRRDHCAIAGDERSAKGYAPPRALALARLLADPGAGGLKTRVLPRSTPCARARARGGVSRKPAVRAAVSRSRRPACGVVVDKCPNEVTPPSVASPRNTGGGEAADDALELFVCGVEHDVDRRGRRVARGRDACPSSWNPPIHGDEVDARQVGHRSRAMVTGSASSRGQL